jgi:hypothetical protein
VASGSAASCEGVNESAEATDNGNCFSLTFPFKSPAGGTGYEYQNGLGHCLWQDGGVVEVGASADAPTGLGTPDGLGAF